MTSHTPDVAAALPRYGLRWNGPDQPVSTPMPDGFWTPFHIAHQALKVAEEERDESLRQHEVVHESLASILGRDDALTVLARRLVDERNTLLSDVNQMNTVIASQAKEIAEKAKEIERQEDSLTCLRALALQDHDVWCATQRKKACDCGAADHNREVKEA